MKKLLSIALAILLFIPIFYQMPQVEAATPQFTAARPTYLYGGGISSAATSIKLTSLKTPDGTVITTTQLVSGVGGVYYITIEPSTTKKETVSCTAVTQNSDGSALLTGCIRGLQFTYPYTASASLAYSHSGGSSVVLSNSPQLYNDIISYVNSVAIAGAPDSSLTVKGIVQLATGLQQASSTAIGGGSTSAPLVLYTANATSTYGNGSTSGLKVVVTQNNGFIDQGFLATSTFVVKNEFVSTTTGVGTFTVPTGATKLWFEEVAAGGSSNNGTTNAGFGNGGGGGGGYCSGVIDVTGVSTLSYSIGASAANIAGTNSYLISAPTVYCGAAGGAANSGSADGAAGGAATTSVSVVTISNGQAGGPGFDGGTTGISGPGGNSRLGLGGAGQEGGGSPLTGLTGTGFGAGGAGGVSSAGAGSTGGVGTGGFLRIRW